MDIKNMKYVSKLLFVKLMFPEQSVEQIKSGNVLPHDYFCLWYWIPVYLTIASIETGETLMVLSPVSVLFFFSYDVSNLLQQFHVPGKLECLKVKSALVYFVTK